MPERIVLVGLSGSGKSAIGSLLAARLGWGLIDTDEEIERIAGRSIPEIFIASGESTFREIERRVLQDALRMARTVIATGGGAVVNDEIWSADWLGDSATMTVWLDAPTDVLLARLLEQQGQGCAGAVRPLLLGDDALSRLDAMRVDRAPYYRRADLTIPGADQDPDVIAGWIAGPACPEVVREVLLDVPGGESRVRVADGIRAQLPEVISSQWPRARTVWIVVDERVAVHHIDQVVHGLTHSGLRACPVRFPSGEASKSMAGVAHIHDALLGGGIERSDVIVALGGGVAGDLVGFAAATVLRGVGLVQMPTSLLAMVDSSVGGKTGINHATGKNLIGAFYQPPEVLVDPEYLRTLPDREYRSGWAEIIKHGLIEPSTPAGRSGLLGILDANAERLLDRRSPLLAPIIARNVEIKASVVQADEREAGLRAILNFGHTIGHAIEAAGYTLLHGEAVAVGLHGAMRLGAALGHVEGHDADRVSALLSRFGLPVSVRANVDDVRRFMSLDKKRISGEQQWVVPARDGGVTLDRGVPQSAVDVALEAVIQG